MTTLRVAVSDYLGKALLVPVVRGLLDRGGAAPLRDRHHPLAGGASAWSGGARWNSRIVTAPRAPRGLEEQHLFDQPFVWVGPRRRGLGRTPLERRLPREPLLRLAPRARAAAARRLSRARARPGAVDDRGTQRLPDAVLRLGRPRDRSRARAGPRRGAARAGGHRAGPVPSQPVKLVSRPSARRSAVAALFAAEVRRRGPAGGRPAGPAAAALTRLSVCLSCTSSVPGA